jgi:competence protein ComEC
MTMHTELRRCICLLALTALAAAAHAQNRAGKTLDMYVVDVEGGNATLFVSPSGESLLLDTGNGGAAAARDVGRIMDAVADAGIKQIDHLVTTHWHGDHYGGMAELSTRIPIRHYVDHGPSIEPKASTDEFLTKTYPALYGKARHTVVKPGDRVPLNGIDVRVVTSAGAVLGAPLPGAGQPNPHCAAFKAKDDDRTENAQSVGLHVSFNKFRAVHLGDLTVNKEFELMCPVNRLGTVDLFFVSHHGQAVSNAEVLAHAIKPRVAIMNNGTRKGGQPEAMRVLHGIPTLLDLWQVHFSMLSGQEYTVPGLFIANTPDDLPPTIPVAPLTPPAAGTQMPPAPVHSGAAHWIKIVAAPDGSFEVTNARNGFTKRYQ